MGPFELNLISWITFMPLLVGLGLVGTGILAASARRTPSDVYR